MLYVLFFMSGFAALLYQIVWQRTLFAIYGINIESVTMVVTAFMLGLGLGGLAGGAISKDPRRPTVLIFSLVELSIGTFGAFSLPILHGVGALTLQMPPAAIGVVTFLMVLVPTMLMGGTLPLLVAHFSRINKNVGKSVGGLYNANTLGSALASVLAVVFLMKNFGQTNTVRFAATLNLTASLGAYLLYRRSTAAARTDPSPVPQSVS